MELFTNDIATEKMVNIRIEAVGGDLDRVVCKYPASFMDEMARQLTEAIESACGIFGLADSTVELVMMFASGTYLEHTSGNITYRRLMLLDKVSAPRDFWIKWTRLGDCEGGYNSDNILFELGEDVEQKVREREYRYLLRTGGEKYHNSMGRKKVTEWREVIKRAVKRGEISKVESDFELAPETLELEERIADLLGKRIGQRTEGGREEVPYILPENDEFARAMEKARMVVEESHPDEELAFADAVDSLIEETEEELVSEADSEVLLIEEDDENEDEFELELEVIEDEDSDPAPVKTGEFDIFADAEAEKDEIDIFADEESVEEAVEPELSDEEWSFEDIELSSDEEKFDELPEEEEITEQELVDLLEEIIEEITDETSGENDGISELSPEEAGDDVCNDIPDEDTDLPWDDEPEAVVDETSEAIIEDVVEEIVEDVVEEIVEDVVEEIVEDVVEEIVEDVAKEIEEEVIEKAEEKAEEVLEEPEKEPDEEPEKEEPAKEAPVASPKTAVKAESDIGERMASIRAQLETQIRLEYEIKAREKAEAEIIELRRELQKVKFESDNTLSSLREENERLRLEYELLVEQTESDRLAREAEEARRRAEEHHLRTQIEMQLRAEAAERERLAEAARMAIEEQHRLEAENARIARQKEEEERAEAERLRREEEARELEAMRKAELARIRREEEQAKARAKNAMPVMGDGKPSHTSKTVKLLFRRSVDPNITTRIQEIIKATVDYYNKDNIYLRIKATVPDTQTVVLEFANIPIEEMELLGNIIKVLGNSGLGIAKAIVE